MTLAEHMRNAFEKSERGESKLTEDLNPHNLRGMSTFKVRHFLNNLCDLDNLNYLEIGTWQGSTLCSAMYQNKGVFYAIDHFVKNFDHYEGCRVRDLLFENLSRLELRDKVEFFDCDCFNFNLSNIKNKINVYFYDGEHSHKNQRDALLYYKPILADEFIFIVDDFRDRGADVPSGASKGTFTGIERGNFEQVDYFEPPRGEYHQGLGAFVLRRR